MSYIIKEIKNDGDKNTRRNLTGERCLTAYQERKEK